MRSVLSYALRELGPYALVRLAQYRLGLDTGWIRWKAPLYDWDDRPLSFWLKSHVDHDPKSYTAYRVSSAPKLFLPPLEVSQGQLRSQLGDLAGLATNAAEAIAQGTFTLFGFHQVELGFPPDWHRFAPVTDTVTPQFAPRDKHWSKIDLLELPADVKLLWEVNRFGWVFTLVRAYVITGDKRYFDTFWELFQSWRAANPPNKGLNWHSAQEVSVRMLALIFALYALQAEFTRHPERVVAISETIAAHADRIPATLSYAIAQSNNHLLVEAAGLYSVGSLFPEFRQSGHWRRLGVRWLNRALQHQVFDDGGYTQHSVNYHRLALQASLWSACLAEQQGEPLPRTSLKQIDRMTTWLEALVDRSTGAAPNFGPNDGAEILPLSMQPFDDHRPTLQAASRFLRNEPLYEPGAWDEWGMWLGLLQDEGKAKISQAVEGTRASCETELCKLGGGDSRGYLRTGRFKSRPGHADQLHMDLWFSTVNIAIDAGTYLYNARPPWDNALASSEHHNTVLVDGSEAMIRAGRFLWLNWNHAHLLGRWQSEVGDIEVLVVERFGDLAREVTHRRTVIRAGDYRWRVIDDLFGSGAHEVERRWLIPDLPWTVKAGRIRLDSPVGEVWLEVEGGKLCIIRAGECVYGEKPGKLVSTSGWFSPTYAYKIPALHISNRWEANLPLRIQSRWSWQVHGMDEPQIELNPLSEAQLPLKWVRHGDDFLELDDAHSINPSGIRRDR
jgi:hypothetical protein